MAHNNLILSLSKAMVVVEAGEKGDTKAATDSAIKHHAPLFCHSIILSLYVLQASASISFAHKTSQDAP